MWAPSRPTLAMLAAVAGLGLAVFASVRTTYLGRPTAAASDDGATRREVARLQRQVDALARTVAWSSALPMVESGTPPAEGVALDRLASASDPTSAPVYRGFEAPSGVTVVADGAGIAVHNRDPRLAGQVIMVTGERDDGGRDQLTVVLPAPGD